MVTTDTPREIGQHEGLKSARSWLEYVRRSSPPDARFTIGQYIGLFYGKAPRLREERDVVEYVLAVANGETDRSEIRALIREGRFEIGDALAGFTMSVEQQLDAEDTYFLGTARPALREFLARIVSDKGAAKSLFATHAAESLQRVWILPELHSRGSRVELDNHVILLDLKAFDAFVAMLLLDDRKPYGVALCQCQLASCGRFFLEKRNVNRKGGRPMRLYCCEEHMTAKHVADTAERVRKSRARRAPRKPK